MEFPVFHKTHWVEPELEHSTGLREPTRDAVFLRHARNDPLAPRVLPDPLRRQFRSLSSAMEAVPREQACVDFHGDKIDLDEHPKPDNLFVILAEQIENVRAVAWLKVFRPWRAIIGDVGPHLVVRHYGFHERHVIANFEADHRLNQARRV